MAHAAIWASALVLAALASLAAGAMPECDRPTPAQRAGALGPLGNYTHRIRTSSPEAQALFDQGMLLAAGFNQAEAEASFKAALTYDNKCAMCWWGLAYARAPFQNKPAVPPPADPAAAAYPRYTSEDMQAAVHAIDNAAALVGLVRRSKADEAARAAAASLAVQPAGGASGGHATAPAPPPSEGGGEISTRLMERLSHCLPSSLPEGDAGNRRRQQQQQQQPLQLHRVQRRLGDGDGTAGGGGGGGERQLPRLGEGGSEGAPQGPDSAGSPQAQTPAPATQAPGPAGRSKGQGRGGRKHQGLEGAKAGAAAAVAQAEGELAALAAEEAVEEAQRNDPGWRYALSSNALFVRERHYIAAMADRLGARALWGAEWEASERRYAQDMADIAACWLEDADAAALAAEALANTFPWDFWDPLTGDPREGTPLVLALLNESLSRNPLQPLALHLHIHVTEGLPAGRGPARAGLAEASADALFGLLPGFDHLQHMPSHTFIRVGRWGDAVESNVASLRASARASHVCMASLYSDHDAAMGVFAASMGGDAVAADVYGRVLRELPRFVRDAPASLGSQWTAPLAVWVRFAQWHNILKAPPPPLPIRAAPAAAVAGAPGGSPLDSSGGGGGGGGGNGTARAAAAAAAATALADVADDPALDPVLRNLPPGSGDGSDEYGPHVGPLRGPLNATDYSQDGVEYARVAWHFSRLMALAAHLTAALENATAAGVALPPSWGARNASTSAASPALPPASGNGTAAAAAAAEAAVMAGRREVAAEFEAMRGALAEVPPDVAAPPGQGLGINVPGYRLLAAVLGLVAEARLAVLDADLPRAATALSHAVDVEASGGYFEPPRVVPQPARQCLGWVLLRSGRLREALQTYLDDLAAYPDNPWSIRGLHAALPPATAAMVVAAQQADAAAAAAARVAEAAAAVAASGAAAGDRQGPLGSQGTAAAVDAAAALRQQQEEVAALRAAVAAAQAAVTAASPATRAAAEALRSSCLAFSELHT